MYLVCMYQDLVIKIDADIYLLLNRALGPLKSIQQNSFMNTQHLTEYKKP